MSELLAVARNLFAIILCVIIALMMLVVIAEALYGPVLSAAQVSALHDKTCRSYGAQTGTDAYVNCRATAALAEGQRSNAERFFAVAASAQ